MSKPGDENYGEPQVMSRSESSPTTSNEEMREVTGEVTSKGNFGQRLWGETKRPGSAIQIIIAAVIAIAIGVGVSASVSSVPDAAVDILNIPGNLWLRALRCVVLPLIVVAVVLAMQTLKQMAKEGKKLARWTIIWYVSTTILAVVISMILTDLVWRPLMTEADPDALDVDEDTQETVEERQNQPHDIVVQVFQSFIPGNIVSALANDELLAVLVASIVVGLMLKPDSSILKAVREIEKIVMKIIAFLIAVAPIGVFFLILSNLLTLPIEDIGQNLGVLIGGSVGSMLIHLFVVYPALFFAFTRMNPYSYWIKNSPAWITAWGTASSAGTMPVTLKCAADRGIPNTVAKFVIPLGTLINMDGTAIYYPMVVVFLAATQGDPLNAGDYAIIVLLATLSSIATTPIPSSSLVITIMIANSVGVEITGMYAVVVAIDWLIDRFRTATNVSGDLYAAKVMQKITGITDADAAEYAAVHVDVHNPNREVTEEAVAVRPDEKRGEV
ncbi:hypothetical protein MBLNU230_g8180t1 [Neophaeotheca triangularis]